MRITHAKRPIRILRYRREDGEDIIANLKIYARICLTGFLFSMTPGRSCCDQLLFFATIFQQIRSSRSRRIYRHVPHEPLGRPSLSIRFAGSRFYADIPGRSPVSAAVRLLPWGKQCQAARNIQVVYFFLKSLAGKLFFAILNASQTPDPSAKFGPDPQNCSSSYRQ